jgi:hypothetical protein
MPDDRGQTAVSGQRTIVARLTQRLAGMRFVSSLRAVVTGQETTIQSLGLLAVLGVAVFAPAVWLPPANEDDLLMLSAVARTRNPGGFFVGDWGLGNSAYRPLHSLTLWASYQLFGVGAAWNQVFNLLLHLVCIGLLYLIVRSIQGDRVLAFLFTAMSLVSLYTESPATWVSDRPTMLVALCLLLWLRVLVPAQAQNPGTPPARLLVMLPVLSSIALMSKESGLIIPLFALCWGFTAGRRIPGRRGVIGLAIVIVAGYAGFRWLIFGAGASTYAGNGFLLGVLPYSSWADLPASLMTLALFENVVKNIAAPILPVFTESGACLSPGLLVRASPIWISTLALGIMAWRRGLSPIQKAGVAIVLLNAVLHVAVFRHRILYLSQLGFSLFLAGSRIADRSCRRAVAIAFGTVCVVGSLFWVSRDLNVRLVETYQMLRPSAMKSFADQWGGRVDRTVIDRVVGQYSIQCGHVPD